MREDAPYSTVEELLETDTPYERAERIEKIRRALPHIVPSNFYPLISSVFDIAEGLPPRGSEKIPENTEESYITGETLEAHLGRFLGNREENRIRRRTDLARELPDIYSDTVNDYLKRVRAVLDLKSLSQKEEELFIQRIKQGNSKAREVFLRINQRLVVSVAMRHKQKWSKLRLDLFELVSEGNLGLIRALDKFKLERGNKFSTYATWAIRNSINDFCYEQGRTIRINRAYYKKIIMPVKRAVVSYINEIGREPTFDELVHETGLSKDKIINAYGLIKAPVVPDSNRSGEVIEQVSDISRLDPKWKEYMQELEDTRNQVLLILDQVLNEREAIIIRKRFGIGEHHSLTLQEVGDLYDITRERVRQIEQVAMAKLWAKRANYKRDIKDLLADFTRLRDKIFG